MTSKPILVAGAGLASLLLARGLLRHEIPFLIFERDASFDVRGQGYRLRLSSEGLDAIESVLGDEAFSTFFDACGKTGGGGLETLNAVSGERIDHNAEALGSRGGQVVGVARGTMRQLFMEGCEAYVQWSKEVQGYERTTDGVKAIFSDGTKSVEGSMLIGGEGIRSRVARQLSNGELKVYDTGARGIHGQAPVSAFKGLGEGVFRLRDETSGVSVITNVRAGEMDDPSKQFGWTMVGPGHVIVAPNNDYATVGTEAANLAKSLTESWHSRFKPLFENMVEKEAAFWKITCSSPDGVPEWPNDPRITVIGDAVHSMTPAGGIGANTAVQDSALLNRLLADAGGYKDGITEAYEKEMRVYGGAAVAKSYGMAKAQFGVGEMVNVI